MKDKVLAVFHWPQESGDPYVLFVRLEDGTVTKRIDFNEDVTEDFTEDYYCSGRNGTEDYFKANLEKLGFNMSKWDVNKRIKADIQHHFILDICMNYDEFKVLNFININ